MSCARELPLTRRALVAVLLVVVCGMFLMEWAHVVLRARLANDDYARYWSRVLFLPVLTLAVWLIVRDHRGHLSAAFSRRGLTLRWILIGAAVGILARLLWWSQVTARAAFGLLPSASAAPAEPLQLGYACPEWPLLLLAGLHWFVLVPVVEEFVHRGVVQSALARHGAAVSILGASLFFAAMHVPENHAWAFAFGIVFGAMYWRCGSLWPPIITHSVYDGLRLFDWICLRIRWNPDPADLPLTALGIGCTVTAAACAAGIAALVVVLRDRAPRRARPP